MAKPHGDAHRIKKIISERARRNGEYAAIYIVNGKPEYRFVKDIAKLETEHLVGVYDGVSTPARQLREDIDEALRLC